jgi:hypothetical protein
MTGMLLIASALAALSLAAAARSRPVPRAAVVRPEAGR